MNLSPLENEAPDFDSVVFFLLNLLFFLPIPNSSCPLSFYLEDEEDRLVHGLLWNRIFRLGFEVLGNSILLVVFVYMWKISGC